MSEAEKIVTDRDKLLGLLNDFGITPVDPVNAGYSSHDIILEAYEGNVEGYNNFIAVFTFDETGKFLKAGIWE